MSRYDSCQKKSERVIGQKRLADNFKNESAIGQKNAWR